MYVKTTDGLNADAQKAVEHAMDRATERALKENLTQRFVDSLDRKYGRKERANDNR